MDGHSITGLGSDSRLIEGHSTARLGSSFVTSTAAIFDEMVGAISTGVKKWVGVSECDSIYMELVGENECDFRCDRKEEG